MSHEIQIKRRWVLPLLLSCLFAVFALACGEEGETQPDSQDQTADAGQDTGANNIDARQQFTPETCRQRGPTDCLTSDGSCVPVQGREFNESKVCYGALVPVICVHENETLDGQTYWLDTESSCWRIEGSLPAGFGWTNTTRCAGAAGPALVCPGD